MKLFKIDIHTGELITLALIVVVGVLTRTVLHIGPNFEFVTALTLLSATIPTMPRLAAWSGPLLIMAISDYFIGNTSIFVFTWSGFLVTALIGQLSKSRLMKTGALRRYISYELLGIVSVAFFFFWTNLGVVLLSNMYPHDIFGYEQSLIMALPFLKNQILSVIITMPLVIGCFEALSSKLTKAEFKVI